MPSIVPGFEYDIFISYRQNDNRSGWVTEFVRNLQEELAATIKQPVSVYFDSNPHDGLLETHNVDKSLENKLKTIILIPILSQTYCDTKCFAWQHEFVVFNRLAKEDQFGMDIKLSTGNVASRILPVKIHDLDADDKALLESELGSVLRSIEFIFKSPGVNRPLTSSDKREENANRTFYRDQVNKVANAIKEIILAISHPGYNIASTSGKSINRPQIRESKGSLLRKAIALLTVLVAISVIGYFIFNGPEKKDLLSPSTDKSIAVLPFVNMSNDKEQEYFSDGLTEEILNRLAGLPQLKVMARTSSFAFKGKNLPIQKIADSLGVSYVVEGSVRRADKKLKVTVQLIRRSDGTHIWSKTYDQVLEDVFKIQEDIASSVAQSLDIYLDEGKKEMMFYVGTRNVDAYEHFLKGKAEFIRAHSSVGGSLWEANVSFKKALGYDSTFAAAHWYQHDAYMHDLLSGTELLFATDKKEINPTEAYEKMNLLINRAIQHTPDTSIQNIYRLTKSFYSENWTNLPHYASKFIYNEEAPKMMAYSETVLGTYALILLGSGENLYQICSQAVNYDPLQPTIWERGIFGAVSVGEINKAQEFARRGELAIGESYREAPVILLALGKQKEILKKQVGKTYQAIALSRELRFNEARAIADSMYSTNPLDELLIWVYYELKDKEKANKIASAIDNVRMGNVKLSMLVSITYNLNHLVFDLKSTPNFDRRLQEAGIDLNTKRMHTE